jgi:hypothetical protein
MKQRSSVLVLVTALVLVGLVAPALASAGKNTVVTLRGVGTLMDEPPIEGAECYTAELVNTKTDKTIGSGIDCLEDISLVGDGIALTRTTYFFFPEGTLVASGRTTVAPVTTGSPDFTHIVGDIPEEGSNSIVEGTRRYKNATGTVRLSGAVEMSDYPASVGFNCIFVIDLD